MAAKLNLSIAVLILLTVAVVIYFVLVKKNSMNWQELPFINKIPSDQREAFGKKTIEISNALKIPAKALMLVMNNESGLNPKAVNPGSKATGLIQFIPATAGSLGTTQAGLLSMSAIEQLDYVQKYLATYANKIKTDSDVYLAVFYPAALWQKDDWQFPAWAVKANPIFDTNKDGTLTKREFAYYFNSKYAKYLAS